MSPLSATMSAKLAPRGMVSGWYGFSGGLVAHVLDEQQHQHIILVLAGVHAAAQSSQLCQSDE